MWPGHHTLLLCLPQSPPTGRWVPPSWPCWATTRHRMRYFKVSLVESPLCVQVRWGKMGYKDCIFSGTRPLRDLSIEELFIPWGLKDAFFGAVHLERESTLGDETWGGAVIFSEAPEVGAIGWTAPAWRKEKLRSQTLSAIEIVSKRRWSPHPWTCASWVWEEEIRGVCSTLRIGESSAKHIL